MKHQIDIPRISSLGYRVLLRGLRVFFAGFVASLSVVPQITDTSYSGIKLYIISAIFSGIAAGLISVDKSIRG